MARLGMSYEPGGDDEPVDEEQEYVELSVVVSREVAEAIDAEYSEAQRRRERVLVDEFGDAELAEAAVDAEDVGEAVGQRALRLLLESRPGLKRHTFR